MQAKWLWFPIPRTTKVMLVRTEFKFYFASLILMNIHLLFENVPGHKLSVYQCL